MELIGVWRGAGRVNGASGTKRSAARGRQLRRTPYRDAVTRVALKLYWIAMFSVCCLDGYVRIMITNICWKDNLGRPSWEKLVSSLLSLSEL